MLSDIERFIQLLGNKTKLMLCFVIKDKKLALPEVVEEFKKKYKIKKYRETLYRLLEQMVKSNLLEKEYEKESKKLVYYLKIDKIELDFLEPSLIFKQKTTKLEFN